MADVTAPMVGKVTKILVKPGDQVSEDDPVIMIEAMKVEMPVVAPESGTVKEIRVKEGDTVEGDTVLVVLE